MKVHRHLNLNHIARLPVADKALVSVSLAHVQVAVKRLKNRDPRATVHREARLLTEDVLQLRVNEQIDIDVIAAVGIDERPITPRRFQTRANATPEIRLRLRVHTISARIKLRKVHEARLLRIKGRKNMVEKRLFIIRGISGLRIMTEKLLCQTQHVVRIAGFRTLRRVQHRRNTILRIAKMFAAGVSTKSNRAPTDNAVPESFHRRPFTRGGEAKNLGYLRIRMLAR